MPLPSDCATLQGASREGTKIEELQFTRRFTQEATMPEHRYPGPATTAKIGEHPVHPMLIPFPIALLVATFACDLIFWMTANRFWADAAYWSLVAAIVTALVAALAGFADFLGNSQIRAITDAWKHMLGNLFAVGLAGINLWLRHTGDVAAAVMPWGLILSAAVVALLLYTGWKGGELVYRHRIGVQPEDGTAHSAALRRPRDA
jgi:uncharacterized membrane protein